jgi:hypothetical protein
VLAEQRQTELCVIDAGSLERAPRRVTADAVPRSLDDWMCRGVAVHASFRDGPTRPRFRPSAMTRLTARASVLARQHETEPIVLDLRALEAATLSVTLDAVLNYAARRMGRRVTLRAPAWRSSSPHLGVFVTANTRLTRVRPLEFELGILGMLPAPAAQRQPFQRLTRLMADVALLSQLSVPECVDASMTTLAIP